MERAGGHFAESLGAVRRVFANPNLRRIELAFAGSAIGQLRILGGNRDLRLSRTAAWRRSAIVTAVRQAAAASLAPFAASLADRFRSERVMLASDAGRIGCSCGHRRARLAPGHRRSPSTRCAVGTSVSGAVFRPAEASLVPLVARSPQELTAANVAASTFDSVGVFAGPALGAFLIAFSGYTAAFAVIAATFAWSALFVVRISSERRCGRAPPRPSRTTTSPADCARCSTVSARSRTSHGCGS